MTRFAKDGQVSSWSFLVSDVVDDIDRSLLILSEKWKNKRIQQNQRLKSFERCQRLETSQGKDLKSLDPNRQNITLLK